MKQNVPRRNDHLVINETRYVVVINVVYSSKFITRFYYISNRHSIIDIIKRGPDLWSYRHHTCSLQDYIEYAAMWSRDIQIRETRLSGRNAEIHMMQKIFLAISPHFFKEIFLNVWSWRVCTKFFVWSFFCLVRHKQW